MRFLLAFVPLVLLVALLAVFALNINRDPSLVQSVLIDKQVPQFVLPAVDGLGAAGIDSATIRGEVTVLNVFASWCIPCRDEHPFIERIKAATGVRMLGINQKDQPANAVAFLRELGNPFDSVGADGNGRASIELGVYGVPETFVVDAAGTITYKHIGPIGEHSLAQVIAAIEAAKAAPPRSATATPEPPVASPVR